MHIPSLQRMLLSISCVALIQVLGPVDASAIDWKQFRGAGGASFSKDARLPSKIDGEKAIAWKTEMPGKGPSSPIVVGDRVFVTSSGGPEQEWMYVLCFGCESGKQLWRRQFWATGRPYSHETSSNAAPTPASDGERVYAFYSSNDLVCLDLDGNLVWYRGLAYDYPKAGNDIGMASSPVLVGQLVIVQIENQGDSFAAAIDKLTGKTVWRVKRNPAVTWATPAIVPGQGRHPDLVILQSRGRVSGLNAQTGEKIWELEGDVHTTSSAVVQNGIAYVPVDGVTAMKFDSAGKYEEVWNVNRMRAGGASPVVTDQNIFIRNREGVISCYDKNSGEKSWNLRVGKSQVWSTPLIAGDRMCCLDYDGTAHIVQLGDEPEVISSVQLAPVFQGSPAVGPESNSAASIFMRSNTHLFKIAAE